MNTQQLNDLMEQVTHQLSNAGCEYFLSVMTSDDEATLGSVSINMSDIETSAELIAQSIKQGGANGQRMLSLFTKVMGSIPRELLAEGDIRDQQHDRYHESKPAASPAPSNIMRR